MGVTKNAKQEEQSRRFSRSADERSGPADWKSADPELITEAICAVALRGGAVRFGYTRDGGAYAVGIYGDGEPYTEYCRPSEDIDEFLRDIARSFA